MATSKATLRKHQQAIAKVALLLASGQPADCQALFAAQEAIAQLLVENNCLPAAAKKK